MSYVDKHLTKSCSSYLQAFDWLPEGMEALADGEYDAIIMGTGLKECVISGLLSVKGKKVLHVDRNGYYGADCASLNLTNLFEKFQAGEVPSFLGSNRDYNVDLIPKLSIKRLAIGLLDNQFPFCTVILTKFWCSNKLRKLTSNDIF